MNPYQTFIQQIAELVKNAEDYQLGGFEMPAHPKPDPGAPKVLIFSPHPDDEVIIGAAPLRMMREAGFRVINVAVTQGSNPERQEARWKELQDCCDYIGFELIPTRQNGLDRVNVKSRETEPKHWAECTESIRKILEEHQPHTILFPHVKDNNSTHIGVHWLILDALARTPDSFQCHVMETEFWGAMETPNVMVESSVKDLSDMMAALTFHVGEVKRNPYHLRTPAWMLDNVRRGGELVGRQGEAAPDFMFATLYRYGQWKGGKLIQPTETGTFISVEESIEKIFQANPL